MIGDARDEALQEGSIDGFESSLLAYAINRQQPQAPYVTANVNLWPQTLAVLGNPDSLDGLVDEQRGWLDEATQDAADRSAALVDTDAENIEAVCEAGGRFAEASDADLSALREEFKAAYEALGQDTQTDGFIEQIQTLKESTAPDPALTIPVSCTGKAPGPSAAHEGDAPAFLNGTYRWEITHEEAEEAGMVDPEDSYPNVNTIILKDGKLEGGCFGKDGGTYSVEGDTITFTSIEYDDHAVVTFETDDDGNLHLTPVPPLDRGTAFVCFSQVWTKIE